MLHGLGRYAPWEPGFDFTPPVLASDEQTGPPDFVGIGVQKAGTTWWYDLLSSHPGIGTRDGLHKERHFFDRFGDRPFGPADRDRYHGWFPRQPGALAGEWTPDYFSLPWVPALLAEAAPATRLLLLLRDPVDRFHSGLAHQRRTGAPESTAVVADAVERGFYHRTLLEWLRWFPAEQLLILQYERCVTDPTGQLEATTRFLQLEDFRPAALDRSPSRPATSVTGVDPQVVERLQATYEADVLALASQVPSLDLGLWPHFAYLVDDEPNSPTSRR